MNTTIGKAGRSRWLDVVRRRGVAMNPVDHPMGGGEGKSSGTSRSPWGQMAKGKKTRTPVDFQVHYSSKKNQEIISKVCHAIKERAFVITNCNVKSMRPTKVEVKVIKTWSRGSLTLRFYWTDTCSPQWKQFIPVFITENMVGHSQVNLLLEPSVGTH